MHRRLLSISIVAAIILVAISTALVVRGMSAPATQQNDSMTSGTQVPAQAQAASPQTDTQPIAEGGQTTMTDQTTNSNSSSQSKTNVTVNNQQIAVPENGSVSKTIKNDNGTTSVNVLSNNTGGDSTNSTSSSLNVSTSTFNNTTSVNVSHNSQ